MDNRIYNRMDKVVADLAGDIIEQIKDKDSIIISGIDVKNKNHKLILHILYLVRTLTGKEIYYNGSRINLFKINKYSKKNFKKIKRTKELANISSGLLVLRGLEKCTSFNRLNNTDEDNFSLEDIYDEFYNSKKKRG